MSRHLRVALTEVENSQKPSLFCVTGATSFISGAIISRLLTAGHTVHATCRDPDNVDPISHLLALPGASERLKLFKADLLQPDSFDSAIYGVEYVIHVASIVQMVVPANERQLLIDTAVKGVENVLSSVTRSSWSVKSVTITSSVAAVSDLGQHKADYVYNEDDWYAGNWAYGEAKVTAERRAFEIYRQQQHDDADSTISKNKWTLSVIHPGVVIGPPLGKHTAINNSTLGMFARMLSRKRVLDVGLPFVDVDDVAMVHVNAALLGHITDGQRYLCVTSSRLLPELIAETMALYPDATAKIKVPMKRVPYWVAWVAGLCTGMLGLVTETYGNTFLFDNSKVKNDLGVSFVPISCSFADMIDSLVEFGALKKKKVGKMGWA
jgi:nucleoside-diphosphate-sugar epimerase